mmetsp:Transcript_5147/g.8924  ORF Transcript_5147/g.8924 Transcript_5147/m.8924 type:complete len:80 (+) Transcript_5147:365-604(+)
MHPKCPRMQCSQVQRSHKQAPAKGLHTQPFQRQYSQVFKKGITLPRALTRKPGRCLGCCLKSQMLHEMHGVVDPDAQGL